MIKIFIADNQYLALEGLKTLIMSQPAWEIFGQAETSSEMFEKIKSAQPDVLIIDYTSDTFSAENISSVLEILPSIKILAITPDQSKFIISNVLQTSIHSHLLKECGKDEILEAIVATANGDRFYCAKIVDTLMNNSEAIAPNTENSTVSCVGLNVSDREIEIIKLIAEGYSNKQIADLIFLSPHTINTHRKNIMSKIGVNNTAGIVVYAVKERIITPNKYLFSAAKN